MGTRSCHHCGIEHTALWRKGPDEKPTLCNACGTRWRIRGTLVDYVPKHGLTQIERLIAKANIRGLPLNVKVPRRKRSVLSQYYLTHIGRLHRQLLQIQHEQQSTVNTLAATEGEYDLLIDNNNWMTSSDNNLLGTMLLK